MENQPFDAHHPGHPDHRKLTILENQTNCLKGLLENIKDQLIGEDLEIKLDYNEDGSSFVIVGRFKRPMDIKMTTMYVEPYKLDKEMKRTKKGK